MQRVLQTIGVFWAALMLVMLIFGTMIEPIRHHIAEVSITGYLVQWTIALVPGIVILLLSERMAPSH